MNNGIIASGRHWTWGRTGVAGCCCVALALMGTSVGSSASQVLPDPCALVPSALIASAFGTGKTPLSTSTFVTNVNTCSWKNGQLTLSVGYTALTNPAPPLTVSKVPGVPGGQYETYPGKKSQLTFVIGSAATGTYVVIRNYVKIPLKKLTKIAEAASQNLAGAGGSASGGLISG
jgi:hypothetical protein